MNRKFLIKIFIFMLSFYVGKIAFSSEHEKLLELNFQAKKASEKLIFDFGKQEIPQILSENPRIKINFLLGDKMVASLTKQENGDLHFISTSHDPIDFENFPSNKGLRLEASADVFFKKPLNLLYGSFFIEGQCHFEEGLLQEENSQLLLEKGNYQFFNESKLGFVNIGEGVSLEFSPETKVSAKHFFCGEMSEGSMLFNKSAHLKNLGELHVDAVFGYFKNLQVSPKSQTSFNKIFIKTDNFVNRGLTHFENGVFQAQELKNLGNFDLGEIEFVTNNFVNSKHLKARIFKQSCGNFLNKKSVEVSDSFLGNFTSFKDQGQTEILGLGHVTAAEVYFINNKFQALALLVNAKNLIQTFSQSKIAIFHHLNMASKCNLNFHGMMNLALSVGYEQQAFNNLPDKTKNIIKKLKRGAFFFAKKDFIFAGQAQAKNHTLSLEAGQKFSQKPGSFLAAGGFKNNFVKISSKDLFLKGQAHSFSNLFLWSDSTQLSGGIGAEKLSMFAKENFEQFKTSQIFARQFLLQGQQAKFSGLVDIKSQSPTKPGLMVTNLKEDLTLSGNTSCDGTAQHQCRSLKHDKSAYTQTRSFVSKADNTNLGGSLVSQEMSLVSKENLTFEKDAHMITQQLRAQAQKVTHQERSTIFSTTNFEKADEITTQEESKISCDTNLMIGKDLITLSGEISCKNSQISCDKKTKLEKTAQLNAEELNKIISNHLHNKGKISGKNVDIDLKGIFLNRGKIHSENNTVIDAAVLINLLGGNITSDGNIQFNVDYLNAAFLSNTSAAKNLEINTLINLFLLARNNGTESFTINASAINVNLLSLNQSNFFQANSLVNVSELSFIFMKPLAYGIPSLNPKTWWNKEKSWYQQPLLLNAIKNGLFIAGGLVSGGITGHVIQGVEIVMGIISLGDTLYQIMFVPLVPEGKTFRPAFVHKKIGQGIRFTTTAVGMAQMLSGLAHDIAAGSSTKFLLTPENLFTSTLAVLGPKASINSIVDINGDLTLTCGEFRKSLFSLSHGVNFATTQSILTGYGYSSSTDFVVNENLRAHELLLKSQKYASMGFNATTSGKLDDHAQIHAGKHVNLSSQHGDVYLRDDAQLSSPNNYVSAPKGTIDIAQGFLAEQPSSNYIFSAKNIHTDGQIQNAKTLVYDVKRNLDILEHSFLNGENLSIMSKEGDLNYSPNAQVDFVNASLSTPKIDNISHLVAQDGPYENFHVPGSLSISIHDDAILAQTIKSIPSESLLIDARTINVENYAQLNALKEIILHAKEGKVILGEGVHVKGNVYTEVNGKLGVFCKYGQETIRYQSDKHLNGQVEEYVFSKVLIEGGEGREYEYTDPATGEVSQRKIGLRVISEEGKISGTGTRFDSPSSDTMIFGKEGYDNQGLALYYVAGHEKHKGHRYFNYGTQFLEGGVSGDKILLLTADGQIHQAAGYLKAGDGGIVTSAKGNISSTPLQGYQGNTRSNHTDWSTLKVTATADNILLSSKEGKITFPGLILDAPKSTLVLDAKDVELQKLPIFDVHRSSKHAFDFNIPHDKKKKGFKGLVSKAKGLMNARISFDKVYKKQTSKTPGPGSMRVGGLVDIRGDSLNLHDGYSISVGDSHLDVHSVTQTPFQSTVKTQTSKRGLHLGLNHARPKFGAHLEQSKIKSTSFIPSNFVVSGQLAGHVYNWQQDHSLLFAQESDISIDEFSSHMRQNISQYSFEKLEGNLDILSLITSSVPIIEVSYQKTIEPITTRLNSKAPTGLFVENAKAGFNLGSAKLQGAQVKINKLDPNAHVGTITHLKMPKECHNKGAIAGLSLSSDASSIHFPDSVSGFVTVLNDGHSFSLSSDVVQGNYRGFGFGIDDFSANFCTQIKPTLSATLSSLTYDGYSIPTSMSDVSQRVSNVKNGYHHFIDFIGKASDDFSGMSNLFSSAPASKENHLSKESDLEKPTHQAENTTGEAPQSQPTKVVQDYSQNQEEEALAFSDNFEAYYRPPEKQSLWELFRGAKYDPFSNPYQEQDHEHDNLFSELLERAHQYFNSHQGAREGSHLIHSFVSSKGEELFASESASKAFLAALLGKSRSLKKQEFSDLETNEPFINEEAFERIEKLQKPVLWTLENEEQVAFPYRIKGTNYYLEKPSQIDNVLRADEILKTSPSEYVKRSYDSIKNDKELPVLFFNRENLDGPIGFFDNQASLEGQVASSKEASQTFGKHAIAIASSQESADYTAATLGHEGFHHFWNRYFIGGTPGLDGSQGSFERASHKLFEAYAKDFHALKLYEDISSIPQSDTLSRTLFFKPWQYFAHKYIDGLVDYEVFDPMDLTKIKQDELLLPLEKALLANNPQALTLRNNKLFPSLFGQEAFMQEIPTHMLEAELLVPKSTEFYAPNMRQALEDILAEHPDFSPQLREKAHNVLSSLEETEFSDKSWLSFLKSDGFTFVGKSVLRSLPFVDFAAHYGIERLEGYDPYEALGRGSVRFGTDFTVYGSIFGAMAHFLGGGFTLGAAALSVAGEFLPEFTQADYQNSLDRMTKYANEGSFSASMVEYNYFSFMANVDLLKKILTAPHEFSAWTFDKIDETFPKIIRNISVSSRFIVNLFKEEYKGFEHAENDIASFQNIKLKNPHELYAQALAEENIARAKHGHHYKH